jgi:glucose/arabinose dehydrogenase
VTIAVALAFVASAVAVLAVAVDGRPSERARSRAAADRPCGQVYVERRSRPIDDEPALEQIDHVDEPTWLAVDPTGAAPALLAERDGRVLVVEPDDVTEEVVLDLDDTSAEGDGGLLSLAYDPDGDWLYAYRTTAEQDDVVTAYRLDDDGRPVPSSEVELVRSGHGPSEQHHGGAFGFGPDGYLYIGFGDGGGLGDPRGNAQDGGVLLGKLLRIDPTPDAADPYRVPDDNPFVDRDGWRPEIWAYGLRNPYRLSFDAATGDLWLGDVGQSCVEEINRLTPDDAGANLGWDRFEGTTPFEGGDVDGHAVWPVHTYDHRTGWCALVVGPVVDGAVLHIDYCRGDLMALLPATGGEPPRLVDVGLTVARPSAIVLGPDGFPWVLSLEGSVSRVVPRGR